MKLNKTREQLSEAFINSLKEDQIPWRQGWKSGRPVNAASNVRYRGINAFWLTYAAQLKGYDDPRWCTYKQAQDHGWQVRRGEKGMPVEFWSLYDTETRKKISREEADEIRETLGDRDKFKERIKPISSTSVVFNATQIDGIPKIEFQREPINEEELIQSRDKLIDEMDLIFYEGGGKAFYSPSNDSITMPVMNDFKDAYSYMTTFLHEAGHATGHETRLNRNIENTFGTRDYAREELRAEIASAFTAQAIGLEHSGEPEYLDNHKAYIQSWIERLEKNPNELFEAIKDADQISDYLIRKGGFELVRTEEIQQNKEIDVQKHKAAMADAEKKANLLPNQKGETEDLNKIDTMTPEEKEDHVQAVEAAIDYGNQKMLTDEDMELYRQIIEERHKEAQKPNAEMESKLQPEEQIEKKPGLKNESNERLQSIKEIGDIETKNPFFKMVENTEKGQLQLIFDGKPNEEVRNILKKNGFKWSPKEKAWQRMLTQNARYAVKRVTEKLEEINEQGKFEVEENSPKQNKNVHKKTFDQREYDYDDLERKLLAARDKKLEQSKGNAFHGTQQTDQFRQESGLYTTAKVESQGIYNGNTASLDRGPQLESPNSGYNQGMEECVELELEIGAEM